MSFRNPNVPWSQLERHLSDDPLGRGPWIEPTPGRRRRQPGLVAQARGPTSPRRSSRAADAGSVPYAELHCHSNFSFLDGASHPEELAEEAARLGLEALALTDHDGCYGVVRFAEAARAHRAAHRVRGRADPRAATDGPAAGPAARPRSRHRRAPPAGAGPRSRRATPAWPGPSAGPSCRARRARPARRSTSWPRWSRRPADRAPLAGAHRLSQGGGAGRAGRPTARRPRPASWPGWSRSSAATTWPSSCGTTATRSTRPATTPWPSWPCGPGSTSSPPTTSTTPPRPPPAGHRPGRGAGPAQPRRARRLAARPRPAPTCARGPSRPAASPATPAWSSAAAELGRECAFDLSLVAPDLPPYPVPRRATTR